MPIKMSKVNGGSEEVKIPFGEEELTVSYNKSRLTVKRVKALSGGALLAADVADGDAQEARLNLVLDFLAGIVDGWDVVDDEGAPVPATRETFEDLLAISALTKIMGALLAEQAPDPPAAGPSTDTF